MKTFEELKVGDKAQITKKMYMEDVLEFARLTGDTNLIHIDEEFAKKTIFKKKIVHGFLTASLISNVIGTKLPGLGTIYMSQTLNFTKPVYIDDVITAVVEVTKKDATKKDIELKTTCYNQNNEIVIEGYAKVKAPRKELISEDKMENYLKSENLVLHLVTEEDADFILQLRQNDSLNKYIHSTKGDVNGQIKWIQNYKEKERKGLEYYFRIDTKDGEQLGFVRVYNINYDKKEFTWGSWIMKPDRPKTAAIESALIIYEFAFRYLNMEKAVYDVRLENTHVLHFHDRFGSTRTYKTDLDQYYELTKEQYLELYDEKYSSFINSKTLRRK